ncbi:hypothetical protein GGR28_000455 [Lewinella aquimaris]|uniref:Outer membrane protein beta-barrel domain-containing protein n=1 Tax=Neolewinella aquimaris TaxID=1835722 RepID=A0A840DXB0_9BACT|nr:hypothetical protein [Neolewinella aquimaris]MBB4077854.1 hypothetical protein [Neolewinella aquimaris]
MRSFTLIIALFFTGTLVGQDYTTTLVSHSERKDSYRDFSSRRDKTLLGDLDLTGVWGGPTYNYSSTGDDWSLVRGGFGGLEFGKSVFLGYGGWKARESFTTDDAPLTGIRPEYDFRHGGFIIAVSPGAENIVHPRFTAIVGPGRIDVKGEDRDRMLIGQLMAGAEINLFQWFRLGLEGGYRFASGVDSDFVTSKDVSGAVVQIEARFGWSGR